MTFPEDLRELTTNRLLLRPWTRADREPFAELNADPRVMEHFIAPSSTSAARSSAPAR